jgi:hypothetical protein
MQLAGLRAARPLGALGGLPELSRRPVRAGARSEGPAMSMFTEHQRDLLKHRIARAILWSNAKTYELDAANYTAAAVVRELEMSGFSAAAQRRAVEKVVISLEERSA